jgi:hypothetical protein
MLAKIDEKLLQLTSRFVKKFNWLTGKDNFFLARGCCIVASFFFWVLVIRKGLYCMIFPALIMFPLGFWAVSREEQESERERGAGAKDYVRFTARAILRRGLLVVIVFLCTFSSSAPDLDYAFFSLAYLFLLVSYYFLSVDKPPFSRSRAWEWLKGKTKTFLAPAPVLSPVPVGK